MKPLLLFFLVALLFVAGCSEKNNECTYVLSAETAPQNERDSLQTWLTNQQIQATLHPDGFFYQITSSGNGAQPGVCSNILFRYTGSFLDGSVFESGPVSGSIMVVGELIAGLQKAVSIIHKNGDITVYLPPSLAFEYTDRRDANGTVIIPAGSYVIFQIQLLDVD